MSSRRYYDDDDVRHEEPSRRGTGGTRDGVDSRAPGARDTPSTRRIVKQPQYPYLRRALEASGFLFYENAKDIVVEDITLDELERVKQKSMDPMSTSGNDPRYGTTRDQYRYRATYRDSSSSSDSSDEGGDYGTDDEYTFLQDSSTPNIEFDNTPPRIFNPAPNTWWFDVALNLPGDENSPIDNMLREVTLTSGQVNSSTYARAFTMNRKQPESQKSIKCVTKRIISSKWSIRAEVKDDTIKLTNITAGPNPSGRETNLDDIRFRWIHYQNPVLNLDEFKQQVVRIRGLMDHDLTIIWDLFEKVRDKMERTYIHGKYMEAGAIRCDGKFSAVKHTGEASTESYAATFISIPILKLQPLEVPSILKGHPKAFQSSDHSPRPLMQTTVNMASTLEEDKRQATFSSKLIPKDQAVHVAQTWILVINDKLLVTYSSSSLEDVAGPNIEFEEGKQDDGITIRVGTTFEGAYYFPAEKCQTWFEFQAELKKAIRPKGRRLYTEKDATITCKDGTILDSQSWAAKLSENKLKLFRVTLELNETETVVPPPARPSSRSRRPLALKPSEGTYPSGDAYHVVPYSKGRDKRPKSRPELPYFSSVPTTHDATQGPGDETTHDTDYEVIYSIQSGIGQLKRTITKSHF
ncbi:hypothetical protein TWF718_000246 [Orbilia javanica]|uniref:Uncharacterized protein n=1 Tax=Orbilia javanica TaxID=47235 RepID=A0AAN8MTM3_9PEZI